MPLEPRPTPTTAPPRYEFNVSPASGTPGLLFVLVHGSFVPKTRWTQPGSEFRNGLEEALAEFGPIQFYEFVWRGALNSRWNNSHRLRIQAGQELRDHLKSITAQFPGVPLYLVGHSHGGNVSLYALRDVALRQKVRGIATMATPHMVFQPRPVRRVLLPLYLAFAGYLGVVWFGWHRWLIQSNPAQNQTDMMTFLAAVSLSLLPVALNYRWRILPQFAIVVRQLQRRFSYLSTPLIRDIPHFCSSPRWEGPSERLNLEVMLGALPRFGFSQLLFNLQVLLFVICMALSTLRWGWLGIVIGFIIGVVAGVFFSNLLALLIMPAYVARTMTNPASRPAGARLFYGGESLLFHSVGKILLRKIADVYPLHPGDFVRDYPVGATFEHNIYDQPELRQDLSQWLAKLCRDHRANDHRANDQLAGAIETAIASTPEEKT